MDVWHLKIDLGIFLPHRTDSFRPMIPLRTTIILLFLLSAIVLAAGCESDSPATPASAPVTQTLSTIPTRHTTPVIPSETIGNPEPTSGTITNEAEESRSTAKASPPANYRPDYITMDATSYTTGEVVRFYLVNKGPEITGCSFSHPPYTVYSLSQIGTRTKVAESDPSWSYSMVIIANEPGSATGPLSVDTRRLVPGRYLIRFDCGNNVAREFVILPRSKTSVISPST
jgi:hypothetical protein